MKTQERQSRKQTLNALKEFLSPNTSLLHVNRGVHPYQRDDLIPLSYNFLYHLLLFRTKDRTHVQFALKELDHLLTFQIQEGPQKGNFPVYLHQYPECERAFEVLFSLFPLYKIAKEFSNLIEPKLRSKLYSALKLGIEFTQNMEEGRSYSYLLSLQIGALTLAIGKFLQEESWVSQAKDSLTLLAKRGAQECWGSPRNLSKMLVALQLIEDEELKNCWSPFFAYLQKSWYTKGACYLGPVLTEYYSGEAEEATLYHLYMERQHSEELTLNYSPITRLEEELLIGEEQFIPMHKEAPVFLGPYQWEAHKTESYGYSFFNLLVGEWIKTGGYYPLKLALNSPSRVDHFVLQMGSSAQVSVIAPHKLLLTFEPKEEEELDVAFFWNLSSKAKVTIDDLKAPAFRLDQNVQFTFESHTLNLSFPNPSPKAWGQLMRKDRRTQLIESQSDFYDAHLYFRVTDTLEAPFYMEVEITPN